jgi:nucleotide-binding universal stress UspA family protein
VVQAIPPWDDDLEPFTRHWTPGEIRAAEARRKEEVARALRNSVSPAGAGGAQVHIVFGEPEPCIRAVARTTGADLLVIGTSARKGLMATFIGNTAEKLLGKLETTVLVVPPGPR